VTLGVIKSRLAQYKQATTNLKRADAIAARLGLRPLRAAALQQLSANAFAQGHSDESIAYARQGLTLAREMGDQAQVSGLLSALGNMTSNLGRYQEAATYLLESLSIALDLGNRIRAAFVSTNLGTVYINLGDYAEAARHLDVALRIGEETQHHLRIAFALVIRGQLACARGDDDEAQSLFQRALTLLERLDRPDRLLDLYLHFAELEMERDDIPRARAYLRRAQEISKTMQDYPELRAIMLLRTGECIERSSQRSEVARLDRAATLFEETLSIGRSLRHAELICSARVAMGRLYLKRQRYTLAESAFRAALEGELEHRPLEATARFGLAQALAAQTHDARDGSGDLDPRHAEALREVELSLTIFERIGHRRARAVRLWARRLSYAPRI
jgi:tetratricopeptide (TPR) repeat protein